MSDLISRSQLLKEVEKYKFGAISNDAEREYIKKTILDFIICQPTDYSVDKVVEELEELKAIKDGSIPIIHGKAELELHDKAIRNKAIDDFVNFANTMPTVEEEDGTIRPMWLEEMAEQLKDRD